MTISVVQTSSSRRWLLDPAAGNALHDDPTAGEPWPRSPVVLPDGSGCGTHGRPDGRALEPGSGQRHVDVHAPRRDHAPGEAPRLAVGPDALLLAWATNIGWRCKGATWRPASRAWGDPPLVNVGELDVDGWAGGRRRLLRRSGPRPLRPIDEDGAVLWERPFAGPAGSWRTRRVGDTLFVYPTAMAGASSIPLAGGCVQWEGWLPPEGESGRSYPVVCCDRETGQRTSG